MSLTKLMSLAILAAAAGGAATAQPAPARPAPAAQERKVVTSADQLPRHEYLIPMLPSAMVTAPGDSVQPVFDALDKDMAHDLETLDIRDRATRTGMQMTRAAIAMHRGDYAAARQMLRDVRAQQEKPAEKLTTAVTLETILEVRSAGGTPEQQHARLRERLAAAYGAMPWDVVGDNMKGAKGQFEVMSREVMLGGIKAGFDPAAKNSNMTVPAAMVGAIVSVRNTIDLVLPFREDAVTVFQGIVDRNQVAKVDRWTGRLVSLPASAPGKPVVVGIWDSGTDVALFKSASSPGIAFDADAMPVAALVRPLGDAQPRLPQLKQYIKGAMDTRAAIDSPEARTFKQRMASLKQDEVKEFGEDMAAVGLWVHGTHVAGIAVDGNPFAQVTAVAMHYSNKFAPQLPTEELSQRTAAAYKAAVAHFRKTGARVVNMSWRYSPAFYEGALAYHNVGKTPEERKQIANKLFDIEKVALEGAIRDAGDILFVAGAGNEDNDADFSQYIPAGLTLPNLITVGAVDQSGVETSFSTFGKTVAVHANGFEVVSSMPGGEKIKLSGTSMASPQVANLAAKLFAMKPELTAVQAKQLIIDGAERNGRVNLINPKKTLALARAAI